MLFSEKYPHPGVMREPGSELDLSKHPVDTFAQIGGGQFDGVALINLRTGKSIVLWSPFNPRLEADDDRKHYISITAGTVFGEEMDYLPIDRQNLIPLEIAPRGYIDNSRRANAIGPLTGSEIQDLISLHLFDEAAAGARLRHSLAQYVDSCGAAFPSQLETPPPSYPEARRQTPLQIHKSGLYIVPKTPA